MTYYDIAIVTERCRQKKRNEIQTMYTMHNMLHRKLRLVYRYLAECQEIIRNLDHPFYDVEI